MKKLALHFSSPQSIVGISDAKKGTYNVLNIDNGILFKKKRQFVKTIESIVGAYLNESPSKFDQIIFSLPALIDPNKGKITGAGLLNLISYSESYDGYSFKKNFQHMCKDPNNIYLQDPSTTYVKSLLGYGEIHYPVLLIFDEFFPHHVYIASSDLVENWKYGSEWENSVSEAHFTDSIIDLNFINSRNNQDILKKYSSSLNGAINSVFKQFRNTAYDLNTVMIISKNKDLIIPDLLNNQEGHSYDLIIEPPVSHKNNFPMLGCEIFPAGHIKYGQTKKMKNNIYYNSLDHVLYFSSNGKLLYEFNVYKDFVKHWKTAIKVASKQNFYKFIYEDGSINLISVENAKHLDLAKLKKEFYE